MGDTLVESELRTAANMLERALEIAPVRPLELRHGLRVALAAVRAASLLSRPDTEGEQR